jgi:DNA polymerase alpha subunit A
VHLADIPNMFGQSVSLLHLVFINEHDALLAALLCFRLGVLPLTKQLSSLGGHPWSKTIRGVRSERIEYLLLHEFHRLKYIVPEKQRFAPQQADGKNQSQAPKTKGGKAKGFQNKGGDGNDEADEMIELEREIEEEMEPEPEAVDTGKANNKDKSKRKKPQYMGGLVLEPKKGLYNTFVLMLDFNSLYPSLIREFNICFTSVQRSVEALANQPDGIPEVPIHDPENKEIVKGILPAVIGSLVDRRRQVRCIASSHFLCSSMFVWAKLMTICTVFFFFVVDKMDGYFTLAYLLN